MKIEVSDETIDEVVAVVILDAIKGSYKMCDELLNADYELESYEMQDLAQGLKDLKALVPAYKYFSPFSEHYKVEEYKL